MGIHSCFFSTFLLLFNFFLNFFVLKSNTNKIGNDFYTTSNRKKILTTLFAGTIGNKRTHFKYQIAQRKS